MKARDYIYDWNKMNGCKIKRHVQLEDDTLRDGLQGAFLTKPSLEQRLRFIKLAIETGLQQAMLGFPAASDVEFSDARRILTYLDDLQLPLDVFFLARAKKTDVNPIIQLHQASRRDVCADFFIGMSQLRCHVEQWDFSVKLRECADVADHLNEYNTPFSLSLEDVSRATPESIEQVVMLCLQKKARRITLCDTVGAMTPAGTTRLVEFVKTICDKNQEADVLLGWHGHNDNGLALANSISAIESGVDFISGAFMGIGERSGNVALEQVILYLSQHHQQHFCMQSMMRYCRQLSKVINYPIPDNAPIIGGQVFATATGTHASAIIKAAKLGVDFEDLIFSSVPASAIGRKQNIYLNHNSGAANVGYVLDKLGIAKTPNNVQRVLQDAKSKTRFLTAEDILNHFDAEEML